MEPIVPFEPRRTDLLPQGGEWIYQVKWDGVRMLAYQSDGKIELYNRKLKERTYHYPELTKIPFMQADSFITDGEVIALGADGKPSFPEVMRRDGLRRLERVYQTAKQVPIFYMVFDLLYLNGTYLVNEPLQVRSQLLHQHLLPNAHVQFVPSEKNGELLFHLMKEQGMEGIVCKQRNSLYGIGQKDERWLKMKNYGEIIVAIGGYTLRHDVVNAVLVGLYDDKDKFHFIGKVGSGKLSHQEWKQLTDLLVKLKTDQSPFLQPPTETDIIWVMPTVTIQIRYTEWRKKEGRKLRQPTIQQISNVPPGQCRF